MPTICFLAIAPDNQYRNISYGAPTLEACFEALTQCINQGWQLIQASLTDSDQHFTSLPIDAFDGQCLTSCLDQLRQEWEAILV